MKKTNKMQKDAPVQLMCRGFFCFYGNTERTLDERLVRVKGSWLRVNDVKCKIVFRARHYLFI